MPYKYNVEQYITAIIIQLVTQHVSTNIFIIFII